MEIEKFSYRHLLRISLRLFLFFTTLLLSSFVWSEKEENTVIILSLDGFRHDYPIQSSNGGFSKIAKEGLKADFLVPVYQSSTYPAHVSMATGVSPIKHGILHNGFFDREKGSFSYDPDANWIEVAPLWILAEQQGVKAATFFWVGSETDWNDVAISYSKAPFNGRISEKDKISQILSWMDMPEEERPRLIMSWWHGADSIAHKLGPNHESVTNQIQKQDKLLLSLIDKIEERKLWNKTTLIVVSDHGMSEISNLINIKEILKSESINARLSLGPAVGHIFLEEEEDMSQALKALRANKKLQVYSQADVPVEIGIHESRTGDIVLTTSAPNMLVSRKNKTPPKGMHGYNPSINKEMNGIFYAYGYGVANKSIDPVHQLDLVPTAAKLLGIEIPNIVEGSAIQLD
jgi:predicted AlkP superfamily pyrophosphatase or phosphodiesterase